MLSEWFYAKELHEMFAIVFAGGFLGFFAVAFSILGIKEEIECSLISEKTIFIKKL